LAAHRSAGGHPDRIIAAATEAAMSHVESPTYPRGRRIDAELFGGPQQQVRLWLACWTWLASTIVARSRAPSASTEVLTCSFRLDVAIALSIPRL
jgi:hypothetical protein